MRTRVIDARSIRHRGARQEKPIAVLDLPRRAGDIDDVVGKQGVDRPRVHDAGEPVRSEPHGPTNGLVDDGGAIHDPDDNLLRRHRQATEAHLHAGSPHCRLQTAHGL